MPLFFFFPFTLQNQHAGAIFSAWAGWQGAPEVQCHLQREHLLPLQRLPACMGNIHGEGERDANGDAAEQKPRWHAKRDARWWSRCQMDSKRTSLCCRKCNACHREIGPYMVLANQMQLGIPLSSMVQKRCQPGTKETKSNCNVPHGHMPNGHAHQIEEPNQHSTARPLAQHLLDPHPRPLDSLTDLRNDRCFF